MPLAIELGAINVSAGTAGTGSITLSTSTPNDPAAGINVSKVAVGFGSLSNTFLNGTVQSLATINVAAVHFN